MVLLSWVLCHYERGKDHSARRHMLGTEGIPKAGGMALCRLERGNDHSARGHVVGPEGIPEAGSVGLCCLERGNNHSLSQAARWDCNGCMSEGPCK